MPRKTILLADDDRDLLRILAERCRSLDLAVLTAEDALTALSAVDERMPDLVCLDINLRGDQGLSGCEMLSHDERLAEIPVILLSEDTDEAARQRCRELGAPLVGKSGDYWKELEPLIRRRADLPDPRLRTAASEPAPQAPAPPARDNLITAICADFAEMAARPAEAKPDRGDEPAATTPWVLHIEDDVEFSAALKARLESRGVAVVRAFDGREGYLSAFRYPADAIILDIEMPEGQGDYVLRRLKENPITRDIPVLILTGRRDNSLKRTLLNMGADSFFVKPADFNELCDALARYLPILDRDAPALATM